MRFPQHPDWDGSFGRTSVWTPTRMLIRRKGTPNQPLSTWNMRSPQGWPWGGDGSGQLPNRRQWYRTRAYDLGEEKDVTVYNDYQLHQPTLPAAPGETGREASGDRNAGIQGVLVPLIRLTPRRT